MYKGELTAFPKEIVEKLLEHQIAQGNPANASVFEEDITADKNQGGIDWDATPEQSHFWNQVLMLKKFELFKETYKETYKTPVHRYTAEEAIYIVQNCFHTFANSFTSSGSSPKS